MAKFRLCLVVQGKSAFERRRRRV